MYYHYQPMNKSHDCVPCTSWPTSVATSFMQRDRKWPPKHLIEKIVKQGCYVVAKGHPQSPSADLEWRLSFTMAEQMLFRNMDSMKQAVIIITKYILGHCHRKCITTVVKGDTAVSNYHLKTLFLWEWEMRPDEWRYHDK